jgi:hypothetical protein
MELGLYTRHIYFLVMNKWSHLYGAAGKAVNPVDFDVGQQPLSPIAVSSGVRWKIVEPTQLQKANCVFYFTMKFAKHARALSLWDRVEGDNQGRGYISSSEVTRLAP